MFRCEGCYVIECIFVTALFMHSNCQVLFIQITEMTAFPPGRNEKTKGQLFQQSSSCQYPFTK